MKAMIIDDNSLICNIESHLLRRQGFEVESFTNPMEALRVFDQAPACYDLVLTDWEMPELNGAKLIQHLHEKCPTLPIVIVTALEIDALDIRALAVNSVILKPFKVNDFLRIISQVQFNNELASGYAYNEAS